MNRRSRTRRRPPPLVAQRHHQILLSAEDDFPPPRRNTISGQGRPTETSRFVDEKLKAFPSSTGTSLHKYESPLESSRQTASHGKKVPKNRMFKFSSFSSPAKSSMKRSYSSDRGQTKKPLENVDVRSDDRQGNNHHVPHGAALREYPKRTSSLTRIRTRQTKPSVDKERKNSSLVSDGSVTTQREGNSHERNLDFTDTIPEHKANANVLAFGRVEQSVRKISHLPNRNGLPDGACVDQSTTVSQTKISLDVITDSYINETLNDSQSNKRKMRNRSLESSDERKRQVAALQRNEQFQNDLLTQRKQVTESNKSKSSNKSHALRPTNRIRNSDSLSVSNIFSPSKGSGSKDKGYVEGYVPVLRKWKSSSMIHPRQAQRFKNKYLDDQEIIQIKRQDQRLRSRSSSRTDLPLYRHRSIPLAVLNHAVNDSWENAMESCRTRHKTDEANTQFEPSNVLDPSKNEKMNSPQSPTCLEVTEGNLAENTVVKQNVADANAENFVSASDTESGINKHYSSMKDGTRCRSSSYMIANQESCYTQRYSAKDSFKIKREDLKHRKIIRRQLQRATSDPNKRFTVSSVAADSRAMPSTVDSRRNKNFSDYREVNIDKEIEKNEIRTHVKQNLRSNDKTDKNIISKSHVEMTSNTPVSNKRKMQTYLRSSSSLDNKAHNRNNKSSPVVRKKMSTEKSKSLKHSKNSDNLHFNAQNDGVKAHNNETIKSSTSKRQDSFNSVDSNEKDGSFSDESATSSGSDSRSSKPVKKNQFKQNLMRFLGIPISSKTDSEESSNESETETSASDNNNQTDNYKLKQSVKKLPSPTSAKAQDISVNSKAPSQSHVSKSEEELSTSGSDSEDSSDYKPPKRKNSISRLLSRFRKSKTNVHHSDDSEEKSDTGSDFQQAMKSEKKNVSSKIIERSHSEKEINSTNRFASPSRTIVEENIKHSLSDSESESVSSVKKLKRTRSFRKFLQKVGLAKASSHESSSESESTSDSESSHEALQEDLQEERSVATHTDVHSDLSCEKENSTERQNMQVESESFSNLASYRTTENLSSTFMSNEEYPTPVSNSSSMCNLELELVDSNSNLSSLSECNSNSEDHIGSSSLPMVKTVGTKTDYLHDQHGETGTDDEFVDTPIKEINAKSDISGVQNDEINIVTSCSNSFNTFESGIANDSFSRQQTLGSNSAMLLKCEDYLNETILKEKFDYCPSKENTNGKDLQVNLSESAHTEGDLETVSDEPHIIIPSFPVSKTGLNAVRDISKSDASSIKSETASSAILNPHNKTRWQTVEPSESLSQKLVLRMEIEDSPEKIRLISNELAKFESELRQTFVECDRYSNTSANDALTTKKEVSLPNSARKDTRLQSSFNDENADSFSETSEKFQQLFIESCAGKSDVVASATPVGRTNDITKSVRQDACNEFSKRALVGPARSIANTSSLNRSRDRPPSPSIWNYSLEIVRNKADSVLESNLLQSNRSDHLTTNTVYNQRSLECGDSPVGCKCARRKLVPVKRFKRTPQESLLNGQEISNENQKISSGIKYEKVKNYPTSVSKLPEVELGHDEQHNGLIGTGMEICKEKHKFKACEIKNMKHEFPPWNSIDPNYNFKFLHNNHTGSEHNPKIVAEIMPSWQSNSVTKTISEDVEENFQIPKENEGIRINFSPSNPAEHLIEACSADENSENSLNFTSDSDEKRRNFNSSLKLNEKLKTFVNLDTMATDLSSEKSVSSDTKTFSHLTLPRPFNSQKHETHRSVKVSVSPKSENSPGSCRPVDVNSKTSPIPDQLNESSSPDHNALPTSISNLEQLRQCNALFKSKQTNSVFGEKENSSNGRVCASNSLDTEKGFTSLSNNQSTKREMPSSSVSTPLSYVSPYASKLEKWNSNKPSTTTTSTLLAKHFSTWNSALSQAANMTSKNVPGHSRKFSDSDRISVEMPSTELHGQVENNNGNNAKNNERSSGILQDFASSNAKKDLSTKQLNELSSLPKSKHRSGCGENDVAGKDNSTNVIDTEPQEQDSFCTTEQTLTKNANQMPVISVIPKTTMISKNVPTVVTLQPPFVRSSSLLPSIAEAPAEVAQVSPRTINTKMPLIRRGSNIKRPCQAPPPPPPSDNSMFLNSQLENDKDQRAEKLLDTSSNEQILSFHSSAKLPLESFAPNQHESSESSESECEEPPPLPTAPPPLY